MSVCERGGREGGIHVGYSVCGRWAAGAAADRLSGRQRPAERVSGARSSPVLARGPRGA
ncbi:hypothetical protein Ga0080559_TMP293 (plasmid) [Salipiger profundus]|uniref:Uncharacterized protein n=1 Tax=Salipiger profundus TaxID=1229727 RepID=A0A1U7DCH9_9RHOB|nr:hypothetical protein Ga0080559_TMP293 [Salipiger profundus]